MKRRAGSRRRSGLIYLGGAIVGVFVLLAVLGPAVSPYDPVAVEGTSLEAPSAHHLLGTNDIGQDIFSELIGGTRRSLIVAVGSSAFVMATGVFIGIGAGLMGGGAEQAVMRVTDIFLAMPMLPILMLVAALAGGGVLVLILTFGFVGWPMIARIVRSQTRTLRRRGFVSAARGFGGGFFYLIRRHLAPALGPVIATGFATAAAVAIFIESGLAFLGLGDPTSVSWGNVLNRALQKPGLFLSDIWTWWVLPAGLTVTLCVLGFTFVAIGLDPRFNPRSRAARW